jgi:D-beta-D-heptose 7-phosphate kinase/D-beta-D-heptose 1-phosphate adenosyltransferase
MSTLSPELSRRLAQWSAAGLRVVFTNGVFDLLHPGHLAILEAARALGDVLVVGLNSDVSARTLGKGEGRPVLDETARSRMLVALRCVDAVELFNEPTPLRLIRDVRPDVLVKGGDYADREVVGRDVVEAAGGRVVLVPLLPGYSTTALLEHIRALK